MLEFARNDLTSNGIFSSIHIEYYIPKLIFNPKFFSNVCIFFSDRQEDVNEVTKLTKTIGHQPNHYEDESH